jgi:hypothetical protein
VRLAHERKFGATRDVFFVPLLNLFVPHHPLVLHDSISCSLSLPAPFVSYSVSCLYTSGSLNTFCTILTMVRLVLNELCFWTSSIVWCLKKIEELKIIDKISQYTRPQNSQKGQLLTTEPQKFSFHLLFLTILTMQCYLWLPVFFHSAYMVFHYHPICRNFLNFSEGLL